MQITSLSADLYPGDVLSVTLNARISFLNASDHRSMLNQLKALRLPKQLPTVDALIREAIILIQGDRSSPRTEAVYSDYFLMSIAFVEDPEILDQILGTIRSDVTALLIGASETALLRDEVITRVLDASAELNAKAVGEQLLLNRQGLVYLRSTSHYRGPHPNRFPRARDLAKLALFSRELLRDSRQFSLKHRELANFVVRRIEQWIEYPELVFDASVSETRTWEALIEHLLLDQRLSAWDQLYEANENTVARSIGLSEPPWWTSDRLNTILEKGVQEEAQNGS
jgi:hypothetical protein